MGNSPISKTLLTHALLELSVECASNDATNPALHEITLTILGLENEKFSNVDRFERVSSTRWRRGYIIDL